MALKPAVKREEKSISPYEYIAGREKRRPLSRTSVGRVVLRRADQPLEKTLDRVKR